MKIVNLKIEKLLADLDALCTFARVAASSAASEVPLPLAGAGTPVLDDILNAYRTDEQADRAGLFKAAVAKMKLVVDELGAADVLIDPPEPAVMDPA